MMTSAEIDYRLMEWTDGPKYILACPDSSVPVLKKATMIGSPADMVAYINNFKAKIGTFYIDCNEGTLFILRQVRPDLDIRQL